LSVTNVLSRYKKQELNRSGDCKILLRNRACSHFDFGCKTSFVAIIYQLEVKLPATWLCQASTISFCAEKMTRNLNFSLKKQKVRIRPKVIKNLFGTNGIQKMAGKVGLEPTTNRLTVYCANQLRYSPVI
jgi:hypothetical protein